MFSWFRRKYIPPVERPSDKDLFRMRDKYMMEDDADGLLLVDTIRSLETDREKIILAERARLAQVVKDAQGERGPTDWGKGYYDAAEDMLDILDKGI